MFPWVVCTALQHEKKRLVSGKCKTRNNKMEFRYISDFKGRLLTMSSLYTNIAKNPIILIIYLKKTPSPGKILKCRHCRKLKIFTVTMH